MDMLSFLFGKKTKKAYTRLSDKTWVDQHQKYNGLIQDLTSQSGELHFVISFFKKTEQQLQAKLEQKGHKFIVLGQNTLPDSIDSNTAIVMDANQIHHSHFLSLVRKNKTSIILHFVEHYPKLVVEDSCLELLNGLENKITVQFYNSLDEPLFLKFGGNNIVQLMERVGMEKEEHISHSMVDRSIQKMQQKLDAAVANEIKASSIEEWLSVNTSAQLK